MRSRDSKILTDIEGLESSTIVATPERRIIVQCRTRITVVLVVVYVLALSSISYQYYRVLYSPLLYLLLLLFFVKGHTF